MPTPKARACLRMVRIGFLAGGLARGRDEPEHLVHVDQGPQVAGSGLGPHPGDQFRQHQGHDELALVVGEVRQVDDRGPRLAVVGPQQALHVEVGPVPPRRERRRGDQRVELHRQRQAVLLGEEGVDVEHAEFADRGAVDLRQQRLEVEVLAGCPGPLDQVGDQDVLAARQRVGVDADQAEDAGGEPFDLVAEGLGLVLEVEVGCRRATR